MWVVGLEMLGWTNPGHGAAALGWPLSWLGVGDGEVNTL
jgi:hypothetical protein